MGFDLDEGFGPVIGGSIVFGSVMRGVSKVRQRAVHEALLKRRGREGAAADDLDQALRMLRFYKERAEEMAEHLDALTARRREAGADAVAGMVGLTKPYTFAKVKAARRETARTLHPDVCGGPLATQMFQAVNAALDEIEERTG